MEKHWISGLLWNIRYRISLWPKHVGMAEGFLVTILAGYGCVLLYISSRMPKPLPLIIPIALFGLAFFFACTPCFPRKSRKQ